jgi:phosphatidylglycerophosphatase A
MTEGPEPRPPQPGPPSGPQAPREPQAPKASEGPEEPELPPLTPGRAFVVKLRGSCFGLGFLPFAPGTWGSLAAFAAWLALVRLAGPHMRSGFVDMVVIALMVFLSFATLGLGGPAERAARAKDPRWFVLDELAGAFLALYGLAGYNVWWAAGAFLFFRLLDASKFGAIGWAERKFSGGVGILMDDLFAGAAANLTFRGAVWLLVR